MIAVVVAGASSVASAAGAAPETGGIGEELSLWTVLPFLGTLLSIAFFPLIAPHFWHRHYPKVSLAWAAIFTVPFLWIYRGEGFGEVLHILSQDYVPFIILLWGLFTVAGGLVVRGTLAGTPGVNTAILAIGTLIASWVGTTGAAMLLIRPYLRANARRRRKVHLVVFFIFLVANVGGALTPLGDPPLLLGFLHGVPFFWTMRLFPSMALVSVILLALFYLVDRRFHALENPDQAEPATREPLRVDGLYNLIFLAGIVLAVLASGSWHPEPLELGGVVVHPENVARNTAILSMGLLALWLTPKRLRQDNQFTWEPMREVAILFFGIFLTMLPALAILRAGEQGAMGLLVRSVQAPWQYFWSTGVLSSFLDNAPTYLTFFNTQLGRFYPGMPEAAAVARLTSENVVYLEAISTGAVYMGANTYIGNAPNFMVKSIAEESGVPMPSFFGYLLKWSVPILIPLFVLVTLVFY